MWWNKSVVEVILSLQCSGVCCFILGCFSKARSSLPVHDQASLAEVTGGELSINLLLQLRVRAMLAKACTLLV